MQTRFSDFEARSSLVVKNKRPRQSAGKGLAAIAVSRLESRRGDSRNEDRHRIEGRQGTVTFRGREHTVEVVNVSGGGAMIAATICPNVNERIDLTLGTGAPLQCLVRWIKEGRIGLEFAAETQLNCSQTLQHLLLREAVKGVSSDQPARAPDVHVVADIAPNHRADARHPLIWFGELLYGPHKWEVRLRDVSDTGALIECPEALVVGSQVLLDLGKAGSLSANVMWAVGDQAGLSFHDTFDMRRLSQARPRVAPVEWLRPAYLEVCPNPETKDDGWNRMSLEQLQAELEGFLKR